MPNRERGDWWDRSWTIVSGCNWPEGEMPEECRYCFAEPMCERFREIHGPVGEFRESNYVFNDNGTPILEQVLVNRSFRDVRTHPDRLANLKPTGKALTWHCSIAGDLFHLEVPDLFIADVLTHARDVQRERKRRGLPLHRLAILTKRYERAATFCKSAETWPANCILMFSAGTQANVDRACAAAAKLPDGVRWGLHLEPLLEGVRLRLYPRNKCQVSVSSDGCSAGGYTSLSPSWIVVGGETCRGEGRSIRDARPCHPDWVRGIRDQCQAAGVPFFLKSWGEWREILHPTNEKPSYTIRKHNTWFECIGKSRAGRVLDGRTWDDMPAGWEVSDV